MAGGTFSERATVMIKLERTADQQITCVVCGREKCGWEFQAFVHGKRVWSGIHEACAKLAGTFEEKP